MYRFLTVLALAALLAACSGQGAGGTDQATSSPVSTPAGSPDESGGAAAGTASSECSESFSAVAEANPESMTDLGDLQAEVEPTIEACESLDEWVAAAAEVIDDEVNPNTAALLLRMSCGRPALANTPLCQELASS